MDVGFGVVDVFGALRVEGMEVSLQWVQERKEKEIRDSKKTPQLFKSLFCQGKQGKRGGSREG